MEEWWEAPVFPNLNPVRGKVAARDLFAETMLVKNSIEHPRLESKLTCSSEGVRFRLKFL